MDPEHRVPRLDEGYAMPVAGIRRDRETDQWFVGVFDRTAQPVEHGPFATEAEARAALADLVNGQSDALPIDE